MKKSITIIPVLWSRKDKNGLYPIKIRTTKDRKSSYIQTGYSIKKSDWSDFKKSVKSSNEDHDEINEKILFIIEELEESGKLDIGIITARVNFLSDFYSMALTELRLATHIFNISIPFNNFFLNSFFLSSFFLFRHIWQWEIWGYGFRDSINTSFCFILNTVNS